MRPLVQLFPVVLVCLVGLFGIVSAQSVSIHPRELDYRLDTEVHDANGNWLWRADSAEPGQIVRYRISVINNGERPILPGSAYLIVRPPEDVLYLVGTARDDGILPNQGAVRVEYSTDGRSFSSDEPLNTSAIRWTYLSTLQPGEVFHIGVRGQVVRTAQRPRYQEASRGADSDGTAFTQAMFGHLGIIEVACPGNLSSDPALTCGETRDAFGLFQQQWDLYSDWESRVPVVPRPTTAWRRDQDGVYERSYQLASKTYRVAYMSEGEAGFVVVIYE